ncbi:MAG TPA: hypothetical protein VGW38_10075, partial [Chloroflexota bacterium]|nr:hypothetical protein [Chloroflexota bacterium]
VEVIRDGEVVARIVPVGTTGLKSGQSNTWNGIRMEPRPLSPEERERFDALWKEREDLAKRTARYWPDDLTAVDALREGRRDL